MKSSIQVLQNERLQYLAKDIQLLSSNYPGRDIKLCYMVANTLPLHVIAAWNSLCHQESLMTGNEYEDILVEDWRSMKL